MTKTSITKFKIFQKYFFQALEIEQILLEERFSVRRILPVYDKNPLSGLNGSVYLKVFGREREKDHIGVPENACHFWGKSKRFFSQQPLIKNKGLVYSLMTKQTPSMLCALALNASTSFKDAEMMSSPRLPAVPLLGGSMSKCESSGSNALTDSVILPRAGRLSISM